ncbi:MAG: cytochrome c-type biogenesis protein CcmH, partial [Candidatus Dormibacteraeota bacterium]|nr:cytochrome c-type biogenesis protein CcmH [Candidatus Dormibacteraeota bacterium]
AAPMAVVIAAAIGGLAFANLYLAPAPASAQLAVEQRLMCPQCEAVRLDVCDRPICTDMKADIARRLQAGESENSIVASYRQAYGSSVLANDQPSGAAALLPWAALAIGLLALLGAGLRRAAR